MYIPSDAWECLNTGNEWHNIILQSLGRTNPYSFFLLLRKIGRKKEESEKVHKFALGVLVVLTVLSDDHVFCQK